MQDQKKLTEVFLNNLAPWRIHYVHVRQVAVVASTAASGAVVSLQHASRRTRSLGRERQDCWQASPARDQRPARPASPR